MKICFEKKKGAYLIEWSSNNFGTKMEIKTQE